MSSPVRKRSLTVAGHRTSISLEDPFWSALRDVARDNRQSVATLVAEIDKARGQTGLSSAIRSFLLEHYREKSR
ncbi:MAG: ribbon-helix-helix domain-containing protein [Hyphomicrobiales bacterium]|nr:ribbon-helix-helix domain-containing protein [Hyphomicrobiales bacterium]